MTTIELSDEERDSGARLITFALRATKFLFDAWGGDYYLSERDSANAQSLIEKLQRPTQENHEHRDKA